MAVGTTELTCYQKEDVVWDFTVSDPNVSTISGWTIVLKIKAENDDADPPLLTDTCSVTGTLTFRAELNINIAPGTYVYGVRRTDSGFSWELATSTLTVLDTPSVDV
jgi:hypothetical protein